MNMATTEFGHCSASEYPAVEALFDSNQVHKDAWPFYGAVLGGIFLGFRVLTLLAMQRRALSFSA